MESVENPRRTPFAPKKSCSLRGRLKSFQYAWKGIWALLVLQPNARIHAVATVAVVLAGWGFGVTVVEWMGLVLAILAVWSAEAMNTAFEFLADATHPSFHPLIGKAKDVAAGAVLIAAVGAAVIGALVFWPYVRALLAE